MQSRNNSKDVLEPTGHAMVVGAERGISGFTRFKLNVRRSLSHEFEVVAVDSHKQNEHSSFGKFKLGSSHQQTPKPKHCFEANFSTRAPK